MKKYYHAIPFIGLFFLLTNCAKHDLDSALQQGAKKLIATQVQELVIDSSVKMEGYGQTATVDFHQDGTLSGSNITGEKDKGEWKVKGDDLCLFFKKWGQGDIACYQVVQNGSDYKLFNHKGMLFYDLNVITPGEKRSQPDIASKQVNATAAIPPSSEAKATSESSLVIMPVSPQAVADADFIIRQSAQNCPGCNLAHAKLAGQTLIGANLQGANLTEADLSQANLRRANLRGANLYRANLRQADLAGADLTGANLSEALRD
jgi:hypothetical protein